MRPGRINRWLPLLLCGAIASATVDGAELSGANESLIVDHESISRPLISLLQEPLAAAVSPDGRWLATGHDDGGIVLWSCEDGRPLRRLIGHTDIVTALAFSSDGSRLASGAVDHSLRVWNAATGELLSVMNGHTAPVAAVAFSADGFRLLSGSYDHTSRLWDVEHLAATPIETHEHQATVCCVTFAPSSERFATGDLKGEIQIWQRPGETPAICKKSSDSAVRALVFSPESGDLYSGDDQGQILQWDAASATPRETTIETHSAPISRLAISQAAGLLASADRNGEIRTWLLSDGELVSQLEGQEDEITGLAFVPQTNAVVAASLDRTVREWRSKLPATPRLSVLEGDKSRLWTIALAPHDGSLFAAGRHGFLAQWELATGKRVRNFEGFNETVDAIALSPDGKRLAVCGWKDKAVVILNVESGVKERDLEGDSLIRCVRFSPDGKSLAVGDEGGALRIWNCETFENPRVIATGGLPVYDIAFSTDGLQAATCSGDWKKAEPGYVTLWDPRDWSEIKKMTEHSKAVRTVVFNEDGTRLASAGEDGLVILWDTKSHAPVTRLQNAAGVRPLAFSPDSSLLAAGVHDATINVWNIERAEIVQRFRTEDDVFALTYADDGTVLFSASGEPRVEIWPGTEPETTAQRIRSWEQ